MSIGSCLDCAFWFEDAYFESDADKWQFCRRFPPKEITQWSRFEPLNQVTYIERRFGWPKTYRYDCCGEFKKRVEVADVCVDVKKDEPWND